MVVLQQPSRQKDVDVFKVLPMFRQLVAALDGKVTNLSQGCFFFFVQLSSCEVKLKMQMMPVGNIPCQ